MNEGDIILGPNDVNVTANGATADIVTAGANDPFFSGIPGAIVSTGGTVTLKAGQDILVGRPLTDSPLDVGDVVGGGSVALNAGRNITVDVLSQVTAQGTGTVVATAGGDISLLSDEVGGAGITTQGGSISLTTGANGTFTQDASPFIVGTAVVGSNGGAITITADDMVINDPINAGSGIVTLAPVTAGLVINLGTVTGRGTRPDQRRARRDHCFRSADRQQHLGHDQHHRQHHKSDRLEYPVSHQRRFDHRGRGRRHAERAERSARRGQLVLADVCQ